MYAVLFIIHSNFLKILFNLQNLTSPLHEVAAYFDLPLFPILW